MGIAVRTPLFTHGQPGRQGGRVQSHEGGQGTHSLRRIERR